MKVSQSVCVDCHNEQSSTSKPFCYYQRVQKIRHDDPRKPRNPGEFLVCGCGDKCPACTDCDEKTSPVKPKDLKTGASK